MMACVEKFGLTTVHRFYIDRDLLSGNDIQSLVNLSRKVSWKLIYGSLLSSLEKQSINKITIFYRHQKCQRALPRHIDQSYD